MEEIHLCYIWIEKFRNFNDKGINFSSNEKFHFNNEELSLALTEIKSLPSDFYGEDIIDVTALIGKNGAGKSNALELICKLLKGGKSFLRGDFLIIIKKNNQFECHHTFSHNFNPRCNFNPIFKEYSQGIDPLKIIFFSNVIDDRILNFDKDISDLSGNNRNKKKRYNSETDFIKQVNFINTDAFKELDIKTPEKVQIVSKIWTQFNHSGEQILFGDFYSTLKSFQVNFRSRLNDTKQNSNKLYYLLVYSLFIETLKNLNRSRSYVKDSADYYLNEFISHSGLFKNEKTETMILELIKWIEYISKQLNKTYIDLKDSEQLIDQLELLDEVKTFLINLDVDQDIEGKGSRLVNTFSFNFGHNNKALIKKCLGLFENNSMFEVNWSGISSGHKAYLNIFSQIHNEVKRVRKENLLLCIDEGDLYLHPKWQIEFFDKLITVLPKIFEGKIQLILTSHSPFLLSDLPKQSITIIEAENNRIFDGTTLKHETFAGNIYNLYEEPFFLADQRMSVFANKKISFIIDELKIARNPELENYISLIGDEVIRFHLEKRFKND